MDQKTKNRDSEGTSGNPHTPTDRTMASNSQNATGQRLVEMFRLLLDHFGPQDWWPAGTEFEIIVGAVLTQNTNWKNVEKAIENLKIKGLLTFEALRDLPPAELAQAIRPAGYYNIKTDRISNLVRLIVERYEGSLSAFLSEETHALREALLSVKGIGPETADSIILYAARRPLFVVDAYTYRILHRHGMVGDQASYEELQHMFTDHLTEDYSLFNEFHALIVQTGKNYCKRKPLCEICPLEHWGPITPRIDWA